METDTEMKMLRVIHTAKKAGRIGVVSTYCGAHSIPAGMDADAATRDVIDHQLPELVVRSRGVNSTT